MAGITSRKHRQRRVRARVTFALLMVLSVILFFAGQSDPDLLKSTKTQSESMSSRIMTYVSLPVRGFENFMGDQRARTRAHEENKRLRAELARLSDVESRANALSVKLSRLQTILNVDVSSGIPEERIAARAVVENGGPFVRSLLLNAGTEQGIKPGYPVMTVDGLIGHVLRVGRSSSRVLHLEDLNSRIPVMSMRSQSRAIMTGDNTNFPKLSFQTEGSDWRDGDLVVTSGDDGILPSGLPIGYLKKSEQDELFVVLYANDNHVDWVWVYPHEPIQAPEDNIIDEADSSVELQDQIVPSDNSAESLVNDIEGEAAQSETEQGGSPPLDTDGSP